MYGNSEDLKKRDHAKKLACSSVNITLIEIPYWWDRNLNSLKATIHFFRPGMYK